MELMIIVLILVFAIVMVILLSFKYKKIDEIREEVIEKEPKPKYPTLDILEKDSTLRKLLSHFVKKEDSYTIPLGYLEEEKLKEIDLKDHYNILVVGTTGGGKSICLNEMISSLIMNYSEDDFKLITIDTSIVELSSFNGIPHYLKETICYPQDIIQELKELQKETQNRMREQDTPNLIVIIDDLYDVCQYSETAMSLLEDLLAHSREARIHYIIATDTPTKEVVPKRLQDYFDTILYLTIAPGEEKDFFFDQDLQEEELEYLTEIGNAIYQDNEVKERLLIPEITDKEIKIIKDWFKPYH